MGGKPDTPKPSSEAQKNLMLQNELLTKQLEDAKKPIVFPAIKIPKPAPPLPPPASTGSADVFEAAQEARRAAGRRTNAGRGTLFAGETGGWTGGGAKTLLG